MQAASKLGDHARAIRSGLRGSKNCRDERGSMEGGAGGLDGARDIGGAEQQHVCARLCRAMRRIRFHAEADPRQHCRHPTHLLEAARLLALPEAPAAKGLERISATGPGNPSSHCRNGTMAPTSAMS